MTLFTTNPDVNNLPEAIENFRQLAVNSFIEASEQARKPKPTGPPDDPKLAKNVAQWEADVAKAKAQMSSTLQQLVQADVWLIESLGRDSYKDIVDFIKNSDKSALATLVTSPGSNKDDREASAHLLNAHAALLAAMANFAPIATWLNAKSSGNTSG